MFDFSLSCYYAIDMFRKNLFHSTLAHALFLSLCIRVRVLTVSINFVVVFDHQQCFMWIYSARNLFFSWLPVTNQFLFARSYLN